MDWQTATGEALRLDQLLGRPVCMCVSACMRQLGDHGLQEPANGEIGHLRTLTGGIDSPYIWWQWRWVVVIVGVQKQGAFCIHNCSGAADFGDSCVQVPTTRETWDPGTAAG